MSEAYTVFWTRERCAALRRLGCMGKPLDELFGGPHLSEPSFLRATVRPGDAVYPVTVQAGVLYVLGRARVRRILSLEDYVAKHGDLFAPYLHEAPAWVYNRESSLDLSPGYVQALEAFDRFRQAHPELHYLAPTCTEEVVECEDSTTLRLDLAVPPDLLLQIRYRSQRSERDLRRYIRDGRLMQSLGVQGIYRLGDASAREFAALVNGAPPLASA